MKLNRLPVLIRAEVTAAAKGENLPSAYTRALVVLQEAIDELSFAKLKQVNNMAEALASYAKASQDEQAVKKAKLLRYGYRRAALWLAKQLAAKRKEEFIKAGSKYPRNHNAIPGGSVTAQLTTAGFSATERLYLGALDKLPDTEDTAVLGTNDMICAARVVNGNNRRRGGLVFSSVFVDTIADKSNSPFIKRRIEWCRNNSARGIARALKEEREINEAKRRVELMRAWCDEFLKNLPRNVSKAK